jgi:hypothetical protein
MKEQVDFHTECMKLHNSVNRDRIQSLREIYGTASWRRPIKSFNLIIQKNGEIRAEGDSYHFLCSLVSLLPLFIMLKFQRRLKQEFLLNFVVALHTSMNTVVSI